MGFAIARNLSRAGFEVRAWNRSREKAEPLTEDGAVICDSAAEAAQGADVVLTMLADADAVLSVAAEALGSAGPGDPHGAGPQTATIGPEEPDGAGPQTATIWLQTSTIGEEGAERCQQLAQERGVAFVDAPVLGSKEPALERKLVILASGPAELKKRLEPLFAAISQRTMWLGEAGEGSRLKLAINAWIGAVVEGGAEVLALAEALGCNPNHVLEALGGGPLDLPYLQMKARKMLEHDFDPSFTLKLAAKDMRLASQAAEQRNLDLPLLRSVRERFEQGAQEHGGEDMSATYLTLKPKQTGATA